MGLLGCFTLRNLCFIPLPPRRRHPCHVSGRVGVRSEEIVELAHGALRRRALRKRAATTRSQLVVVYQTKILAPKAARGYGNNRYSEFV